MSASPSPPPPMNWAYAELGTIADVQLGKMLDKKRTQGTPLRYVRNINVRWGSIDTSDLLEMPFESHELNRYSLLPGDVLVCEGGEPGRAAVWQIDDPAVKYQKALHRVRMHGGILPRWLAFQLYFDAQRGALVKHFTGTTIKHFPREAIREYVIRVAPLAEQHRIVAAIESYFTRLDDAVATLERIERNLKRYRASVLKAAVEGRLVPTEAELARAEGRDYEPASVLLERILAERRRRWEETELAKMQAKGKTPKDDQWKAKYKEPVAPDTTNLPDLPEGWCWVRAEQCAHSQVGHAFKSRDFVEDGVRLLRGDNIGHGELRWEKARRKCIHSDALSKHLHLHLAADDIVVAMDRPLISTGLKVASVRSTDLPALLVQRVIRLRPRVHRGYFLLNLHSEPFVRHLSTEAKGGGVPHVSEEQIQDFLFPLPPLAEQERISSEVGRLMSNVLDSIRVVNLSARRSARLRQSVLKWAFEGRLVDHDPTDEPALRLLERIQAEREASAGAPSKGRRAWNEAAR